MKVLCGYNLYISRYSLIIIFPTNSSLQIMTVLKYEHLAHPCLEAKCRNHFEFKMLTSKYCSLGQNLKIWEWSYMDLYNVSFYYNVALRWMQYLRIWCLRKWKVTNSKFAFIICWFWLTKCDILPTLSRGKKQKLCQTLRSKKYVD